MKVAKPAKLPVLHRVVEFKRRCLLHVTGMLGFPLASPRALFHEMGFWKAVTDGLGENPVIDESLSKARGEVLVAGSFFAPGGKPVTASYVGVEIASVKKRLAVLGDREWNRSVPSEPKPIDTVRIDWAHAFGGPKFDRNPYGKGAEPIDVEGRTVHPLPNVEHYGALIRSPSQRPEPAGFGAFDLSLPQRRERSGTYDQKWLDEHFPGFAADMDPSFFNLAASDQWLEESAFRGDEAYVIHNMHPDHPKLEGVLPGLTARAFVNQRTPEGARFIEVAMKLDTVWLLPSIGAGAVIFHGVTPVADDDAADVLQLLVACEEPESPRTVEHYRAALNRRLDKDKSALAEMSDIDIMPRRESGVVPDIGGLDVGQWVKQEQLALKRGHAGLERRLSAAREELAKGGLLDAETEKRFELPPAPEVDTDDPAALQAAAESFEAEQAARMKELEQKKAEAEVQGRAEFAARGLDYDQEMERATRSEAGPPRYSAAVELRKLQAEVTHGREIGIPMLELEASLANPAFRADLLAQEDGLRDLYRTTAHLRPSPFPLDEGASERVRTLVGIAMEAGESLAGRDLTAADLSGMSLRGVNLAGAFLESANLSGADLTGANLEGAVLAKATLRAARFEGANLRGANLGATVLVGAVFDRADLGDAVLDRADLSGARFAGATLTGARWLECTPGNVDLGGAILGAAAFIKCDFRGARFVGTDLQAACFIESNLAGCDFTGALLQKATFVTCDASGASFRRAHAGKFTVVQSSKLDGADLRDAELDMACLRGTSLVGARLDRASMKQCDLSDCDLSNASLERVVLNGALMIRTRLDGASLAGASLVDALASKAKIPGARFTGANLHGADLSRVIGDAATSFAGAEVGKVRFLPRADVPPKLPEPQ